ncbi:putative SAM-dependent methyltransferase [Thermonema lapsum]|uniref:Putative SAM-dependent methyltransferase n=1 Tax=Thermonema lapsum TaxID=28195 RepID=A0A846MMK2_9BACT|nr:methyltransferase domain-containing protein [Thermonema lapsum]NIK72699.1 putative SAM-dependent methyltransferase [Thermonema lapsum]
MYKHQYLNLGCGYRYHPDWVNIDFVSTGPGVLAYDLRKGIPFPDNHFDVVYHSHVLEHFPKQEAAGFIRECYRVLKTGGILRVVVPDLEQIVREYLRHLEAAWQGDREAMYNYEWIMLEMYDQTVRNESGGEMVKYLCRDYLPNEEYVYERIGEEGRAIRQAFLARHKKREGERDRQVEQKKLSLLWRPFLSGVKRLIRNVFFKTESIYSPENYEAYRIGKFRLSGEVHYWMYDRYSLKSLLEQSGFCKVQLKNPFDSDIPEWNSFELETKNGVVFKPDSLFMEAYKPMQQ